jgi:hypothetical protein
LATTSSDLQIFYKILRFKSVSWVITVCGQILWNIRIETRMLWTITVAVWEKLHVGHGQYYLHRMRKTDFSNCQPPDTEQQFNWKSDAIGYGLCSAFPQMINLITSARGINAGNEYSEIISTLKYRTLSRWSNICPSWISKYDTIFNDANTNFISAAFKSDSYNHGQAINNSPSYYTHPPLMSDIQVVYIKP